MLFCGKFIKVYVCQKLLKYISVWQTYGKNKTVQFFLPHSVHKKRSLVKVENRMWENCAFKFGPHSWLHALAFKTYALLKSKCKVLPYSLPSVGPGADPGVQSVSHHPVVGCHYFPPGLRSPSQSKNVTILLSVPSYTTWWQRHIGVNNLSRVVTQFCPGGNWTHDLLFTSPTPHL